MRLESDKQFFSAMLVAKCTDLYRNGGYIERGEDGVIVLPTLLAHIRFGEIEGVVWTDWKYSTFLIVCLDAKTLELKPFMSMSGAELKEFRHKDGVFYALIERKKDND